MSDAGRGRVSGTRDRVCAGGWTIRRVADVDDEESRTITADQAVEIRESKSDPIVLLVDTSRAGAGNGRHLQCGPRN